MLFIQSCIIGFTFFIWLLSANKKKIPHGLIEWILTVLSVLILIRWVVKY